MLSKSTVLELAGLAPDRKVCAKTCADAHSKSGCKCYPHISEAAALDLAAKVEHEVHAQNAALSNHLMAAAGVIPTWITVGGVRPSLKYTLTQPQKEG
jgi:hypothetical protein